GIGAPWAVRVLRPALMDIRAVALGSFARIGARDDVAPVGPGAERKRPYRADVEVVAAERNRPATELFPVRIARRVAQAFRGRPRQARGVSRSAIGVQRLGRGEVRAVPEGPLRAVARIVSAVPPD